MIYSPVTIIGVVLAYLSAIVVTVGYPILVDLRRNPGARLFFALLVTLLALLTLTVLRVFFGDYPFRVLLLTFFFYAFAAAMTSIGAKIWRNQYGGARRARDKKVKSPHA